MSQAGPSASVPEAQHPQEATWKENRFPGERTLSRGAGEEGGPWPMTVLQGDKEAGVLLSRGGHSTAMNLTSAVPKVTNTPTSVLPPPARPPARPPGKLSLFTGCLDSLGGVGEGSPKAVLRLGTGLFLQSRAKPRGRKPPLSGEFIKQEYA